MSTGQGRNDRDDPGSRGVDSGGLPADDDDLEAFRVAAADALGPSVSEERRRPLTAVPPSPAEPLAAPAQGSAIGEGLEAPASDPLPLGVTAAHAQELDTIDAAADQLGEQQHLTQATIIVAVNVAQRFRAYRRMQAREGPLPTNGQIVFDALNRADGHYGQLIAARQPQPDPTVRFAAGPRQKTTTEARTTSQLNFSLTYSQRDEIWDIVRDSKARSFSALLDAVLDEFLPPLPRTTR